MKRFYIQDLREGTKIEDVFLVASKTLANTRSGSPYLRLKLADRTGEVEAVKWEVTESDTARLGEDEYILVSASVATYKDSLQLTVDSIRHWGEPIDPADFLRSCSREPAEMMAELDELLMRVSNPHLKRLLDFFFSNSEFARKFQHAPAAKLNHHACIGGLLEHTLSVTRVCADYASHYPQLDADLLLVGAALHDIGKIEEFECSTSIKSTESGVLVGHVVVGTMMVRQAANSIDRFDPLLSLALQHLVLSHHGQYDWGSPKVPKSIEALALHSADDLDAKIAMFERAIEESDSGGDTSLFTKRSFLLQRPIFKGHRRPGEPGENPPPASPDEEADLDLFAADFDPFADS